MKTQTQPPTIPCPNCEGCGEIDNPIWRGAEMRKLRVEANMTLTAIASRMNFSKGYISDLELGRRAWTPKVVMGYYGALKPTKSNGRKK